MAICDATGPTAMVLGAFERRRLDVRAKGLRNSLPDQEQRVDDTNRQQDVERATGDIDPEVADRARRRARKSTDERHRQHDAGRRRQVVLMRKSEHLYQVGQRALAPVVLPVGVGNEARRGVERQILRGRRHTRRVERQRALQPHQGIKDQEPADVKEQHADRIHEPALLALLVDAAGPIDRPLDWPQHQRQPSALAIEHMRHVGAEGLHQRNHDDAKKQDLNPADDGHGHKPLRTAQVAAARKRDRSAARGSRRRRASNRKS